MFLAALQEERARFANIVAQENIWEAVTWCLDTTARSSFRCISYAALQPPWPMGVHLFVNKWRFVSLSNLEAVHLKFTCSSFEHKKSLKKKKRMWEQRFNAPAPYLTVAAQAVGFL